VHPIDTHPGAECDVPATGHPIVEKISDTHYFIRGRYGRFKALSLVAPINAGLALLCLLFYLRILINNNNITVIRAGDPLLCGLLGVALKFLTRSKLIVRINADNDQIRVATSAPAMPRMFYFRIFERLVESFVLRNSDAVIAPSKNYLQLALKRGVDPRMCSIVRFGNLIDERHLVIPTARPAICDSGILNKLNERPWILHIGRLIEVKRVKDCFEVLQILAQRGNNAGLCFIGDGPQRAELEAMAKNHNLLDRTWFLGNRDQQFLSSFIPQCTIVLSPLTGRALSEAAFGESAIVAYDNDWQADIIINNESGFLVNTGDVRQMAEKAETLLKSATLRTEFGERARQIAHSLLDPNEQDKAEVELYNKLYNK